MFSKIAFVCLAVGMVGSAAPSSVRVTVSPSVARYGSPVTLTAFVTPANATGRVAFYRGVTPIGTARLNGGTAMLNTSIFATGAQQVRAIYSGDTSFTKSSSDTVALSVRTEPRQGFQTGYRTTVNSPRNAIDFNRDGNLDLLGFDRQLSIELGRGDGTFAAPISLPIADISVATPADFNGDGFVDLALVILDARGAGTMRILAGNGDGTFRTPVDYSAVSALSLIAADMNNDGAVDLVSVPYNSTAVSLLLNRGDGAFQSAIPLTVTGPIVTVADFNNDGYADIASLASDSRIEILQGRGDATFEARSFTLSGITNGRFLSATDFQNDGKMDLAVGHLNGLSILPGNGDGTFSSPKHSSNLTSVESMLIVDSNGDGFEDVIATFNPHPPSPQPISSSFFVLLGKGDGSFVLDHYRDGGSGAVWLGLVADVNRDGRIDVLNGDRVYQGLAPADVAVSIQHTGNFRQSQQATFTISVRNVGNIATSTPTSIQINPAIGASAPTLSGTGWFCYPPTSSFSGQCTRQDSLAPGASFPPLTLQLSLADNAPPALPITVTVTLDSGNDSNLANNSATDNATILQNQTIAFGTLPDRLAGASFAIAANSTSGLPVSFTTQGNCSISGITVTAIAQGTCTVIANQSGNALFLPAAPVSRSFLVTSAAASLTLSSSASSAVAGAPVTLTATVSPAASTGNVLFYDDAQLLGSAFPANGIARITARLQRTGVRKLRARLFGTPDYSGALSPVMLQTVTANAGFRYSSTEVGYSVDNSGLVVADFNGDSVPDIVTVRPGYPVWILPGKLDGSFGPQIEGREISRGGPNVVAADFNGDGRMDIATGDWNGAQQEDPTVSVWLGLGNGTFDASSRFAVRGTKLTAGDFNGDGRADLAVTDPARGTINILLHKSGSTFEPPLVYEVHAGVASDITATVVDLDGNGALDLVFAVDYQTISGRVTKAGMLIGSGNGLFGRAAGDSIDKVGNALDGTFVATGDLNADGFPDLVVQNSFSFRIQRCSITVFLTKPSGGFGDPVRYPCASSPDYPVAASGSVGGIVIADFTGDGKADVAGLFLVNEGYLHLYPGVGDGTLQPAAMVGQIANYPTGLQAADWNGDGRLDFAVAGRGLKVLTASNGPFLRGTLTHTGEVLPLQDGQFQLIVRNENRAEPTSGVVTVNIGFAAVSAPGWNCDNSRGSCTRSDVLLPGSAYPPVTFVGRLFPSSAWLIAQAVVSGGGSPTLNLEDRIPITPILYSISPGRASAGVSTKFTVSGQYLDPDTAVVEINGIRVSESAFVGKSVSALEFTAQLPLGSYTVVVRNGTAGKASNAITLRIADPVPAIGSLFIPIAPCRAADTRSTTAIPKNSSRDFNFTNCGVPANATAVAINVTLVPNGPLGYLSLWPAGQTQPPVSTMNSLDGRIKANAAIVGLGTNSAASIYVTDAAHVVLDVNGYFVPPGTPGGLAFYPVQPCRVLDTRGAGGRIAANGTRRISGGCLPPQAQAYSLNVTTVPAGPLGYLTLWPDGSAQPTVSTLNNLTGTVVANAAILRSGTGGAFNAFVTDASDLIVDLNGYFAPPGLPGTALLFYPMAPCRVIDTRLADGQFGGPSMFADSPRQFTLPLSDCGIPNAAQAYVANATVLPNGVFGFLTLWPAGVSRPTVSTLNAVDGSLTSNAAIVLAGPAGAVNLYTSNAGHMLLDISGYFAP
jgi:hypothetical protein